MGNSSIWVYEDPGFNPHSTISWELKQSPWSLVSSALPFSQFSYKGLGWMIGHWHITTTKCVLPYIFISHGQKSLSE